MGQTTSNSSPRRATPCHGPNNLPPLQFHQVHGDNVRISRDGTVAKRYESFCKGISFSARPVHINERVFVKFSEISNNWSGVIRFGFTYNDPATLRNSLPKYACPDLTNKPGYWAKALNERFCDRDNILFFYVTAIGDVHFGINGEEKGVFISGVETRGPLWCLFDIYGNCTAIEFLDSRVYGQNQYRRPSAVHAEPEVDRILPAMRNVQIGDDNNVPAIRYNASSTGLMAVPFHPRKGRNMTLSADRLIATRTVTEFCQGYVFTARPLRIGEKLIVQVLRTENIYVGALALGLTSCDPNTLETFDLPDDSNLLLDRPEYWVVSKDVASAPQRGDEIVFCVTPTGEVQISKNGGPVSVVMYVDQSLTLWAFLDVYGSTQSVRVLSQPPASIVHQPQSQIISASVSQQQLAQQHNQQPAPQAVQLPASPRRLQVQLPSSESLSSLSSQLMWQAGGGVVGGGVGGDGKVNPAVVATSRVISVPSDGDMIQIQPGGTVLVVNLPPAHPTAEANNAAGAQPRLSQISQSTHGSQSLSSAGSSVTLLSGYSATYAEPVSIAAKTQNYCATSCQDVSTTSPTPPHTTGAECTICYENPIDSVLYMCGHMCMCYDCAIQQWRGIGGGHCPLCRAMIRDVIRTYKS